MTFTILDLHSFTPRNSLDDFGVNDWLSLDFYLFIALRKFYRGRSFVLDKERYFLSMFNTAYRISKMAVKTKRPSLYHSEYGEIASERPEDIKILPPGDLFRKDIVMAMVWCILSTHIKAHPSLDLRVLLEDIREFHINPNAEFCNIVVHNLNQVVNGKKARQLSLYDVLLQENTEEGGEARETIVEKRYAITHSVRLDQAMKEQIDDISKFVKQQKEVDKIEEVRTESIRTLVTEIIASAENFPPLQYEKAGGVKEVLYALYGKGIIPYGVLDEVLIERLDNLGRKEGGVHIENLNAQNLYDVHDNKEVKL